MSQKERFFKSTLLDQPAHGACTMVCTKLLKELGGYSEEFSCQDGYDLWIKLINKSKVEHVQKSLFYYRKHGTSLSTDKSRLLRTRADIIRKHTNNLIPASDQHLAIIPIRGAVIESCYVETKWKNIIRACD